MAKIALLIGVSEYSEGLRSISSAIQDVEAMRRVLEHPDMGDFDKVTVLPNPDKGSMEKAVEELFANRQRDDLVLLYFSGHGLKDQKARFFLSTKDTGRDQQGDFRRATALAASKLQEYITDSHSQRQMIILDCCFSGALVNGMLIKGEQQEFNIQDELGGRGRAILTSSSPIEYSFESKDNDLSIYTKYLVEGIETGAADKDGDQLISVNELHEYASERVKEAAPAMTPKFYLSLEGEDTIYLARSPLAANDPKFKYRKEVEDIIRGWDDEDIETYLFGDEDFSVGDDENFSDGDRAVLDATLDILHLSPDEARTIETEVLSPLQQRRGNLNKYKNTLLKMLGTPPVNISLLKNRDREKLKKLQSIYGLSDKDIQSIEDMVNKNVSSIEDRVNEDVTSIEDEVNPGDPPRPGLIAKLLGFINDLKPKIPKKIFLMVVGIPSIAVVALLGIYYRDRIILPIPLSSSNCPKQTGDFISEGEEILIDSSKASSKSTGTNYFAQCDYDNALSKFKDAWQSKRLDPETLIYLNNALLETKKKQYHTIVVAVSTKNLNESTDDSRAKEMLRGVAQLQTKINLGLFNEKDEVLDGFLKEVFSNFKDKKAINGKGLKVIIANDKNDPLLAKAKAEELSQRPEILGVIGHYPSEMTLATVDIYEKNNLVLISPGSTTNETTRYPRKNFLRTVFSVEQQSPEIAKFLQEKSIKKVVVFYSEESPFSESFYNSFKTIFTSPRFNGEVLDVDEFNLGKHNFNATKAVQELRRQENITATKIGIVLFPSAVGTAEDDAIKLIKLNNSQNWIIGSWGLRSPRTLKQIDNLQPFQKFIVAVPWDSITGESLNLQSSRSTKDFLKNAKNLWGTNSVHALTALSYDATLALTQALEKENTPTRISLLERLKSPSFSVEEGATGNKIEFLENGDRQNPFVEFVHIVECQTHDFDFTFIPIKYSTAKEAGLSCLNLPKKSEP